MGHAVVHNHTTFAEVFCVRKVCFVYNFPCLQPTLNEVSVHGLWYKEEVRVSPSAWSSLFLVPIHPTFWGVPWEDFRISILFSPYLIFALSYFFNILLFPDLIFALTFLRYLIFAPLFFALLTNPICLSILSILGVVGNAKTRVGIFFLFFPSLLPLISK